MSLDSAKKNLKEFISKNVNVFGGEYCEVLDVSIPDFTLTACGQKTGRIYYDVPFTVVKGEIESVICIPAVSSAEEPSYVLILDLDRNGDSGQRDHQFPDQSDHLISRQSDHRFPHQTDHLN